MAFRVRGDLRGLWEPRGPLCWAAADEQPEPQPPKSHRESKVMRSPVSFDLLDLRVRHIPEGMSKFGILIQFAFKILAPPEGYREKKQFAFKRAVLCISFTKVKYFTVSFSGSKNLLITSVWSI